MAGDIVMEEDDLGPSPSRHATPQQELGTDSIGCSLELDAKEEKKTFSSHSMSSCGSGVVCLYLLLQGLITNKLVFKEHIGPSLHGVQLHGPVLLWLI